MNSRSSLRAISTLDYTDAISRNHAVIIIYF